MNIIKRLDIYNPNKHMQVPRETFRIGIAEVIRGLVAVLSLGRYSSGLSADVIMEVISECLKKRAAAREKNKITNQQ